MPLHMRKRSRLRMDRSTLDHQPYQAEDLIGRVEEKHRLSTRDDRHVGSRRHDVAAKMVGSLITFNAAATEVLAHCPKNGPNSKGPGLNPRNCRVLFSSVSG